RRSRRRSCPPPPRLRALLPPFLASSRADRPHLHSFPTRRSSDLLIIITCAIAGAAAGLAGMVEVAAIHGSANASLMAGYGYAGRSEEHTSELQSRENLVCRLLLEKKKQPYPTGRTSTPHSAHMRS